MFYHRNAEALLSRYRTFPAVALLGPRQSGKTTLAQHYFKDHVYVSLENPVDRDLAASDPLAFLRKHDNTYGIIIDEFQHVPELLSYIQLEIDAHDRPGYFVLTGSQNFLMNQSITQSLAGRVGIITLLPFSIAELKDAQLLSRHAADFMLKGCYPRTYNKHIAPQDFYPSYVNTYVERDVRQLINVSDLTTFQKFLALCAGRVGQLLNLTELGTLCGISAPTAKKWLSILEASYVLFRLQPHFNNFNKRLTKTPKLYFYDTGLACNLLHIKTVEQIEMSPFRGHLFENLIISDLYKQFCNLGSKPSLYFWRNKNGLIEVDGLIDTGLSLVPIEIKAGETISPSFFKGILKFNEVSGTDPEHNYIVYSGHDRQDRSKGHVVGWQDAGNIVPTVIG